jgi:hypothetical protein
MVDKVKAKIPNQQAEASRAEMLTARLSLAHNPELMKDYSW